jgi:hypothetical protein
MTAAATTRRRFRPAPAWLVLCLLLVEGLLWLSERYKWFAFNEKKGWTVLVAVASVGLVFAVMLLWLLASLLFRWRFQFSIRSLLVLTVAVALPCSWLAGEMKTAREQKKAVAAMQALHGWVLYDYQVFFDRAYTDENAKPPEPAWLGALLGNDFFHDAAELRLDGSDADKITDADMEPLERLPGLQSLNLDRTAVSDKGLEHVKGMTRLRELCLRCPRVTDAGLKCLAGLTKLEQLWLWGDEQVGDAGLASLKDLHRLSVLSLWHTQVTDAGLKELAPLTSLHMLDLRSTRITDSGLTHLSALSNLESLWLSSTQVTDVGLRDLKSLQSIDLLVLDGTRVTDAGLENVKALPKLVSLNLRDTGVTDEGVKKLQQEMPSCHVER